MERIELPNIRTAFVATPGYFIMDADLAGADAQVVAWEAEEEVLKRAFREGLDVHSMNLEDLTGLTEAKLGKVAFKNKRKEFKQAVHLTNYGGSGRTLSTVLGWTVREAEDFQARWFSLRPGIKRNFQGKINRELQTSRTSTNRFGFRRTWFDRIDASYTQALAWVPQSSVAITTFYGAMEVELLFPYVRFLLQVHDSLVMEIPLDKRDQVPAIAKALEVPIPYDDPLTIRWDVKTSDVSWGDCG